MDREAVLKTIKETLAYELGREPQLGEILQRIELIKLARDKPELTVLGESVWTQGEGTDGRESA